MTLGIVLLAHGSRDPQWRTPIESVARRITVRAPAVQVRCAYLELAAPSLGVAAQQLLDAGATRLRILPLFVGMGKHARDDLPKLVSGLRQAHPVVPIDLCAAVGESARLIELLADLALDDGPSSTPPP